MLEIERARLDALDFDFAAAVDAFAAALAAHATTVAHPAPAAHPLVEAAVRAGGYAVVEPVPAPPPPPPTADDLKRLVDRERDERLAVGFDYDFADGRGVHRFGTTAEDRRGWDEVEGIAGAAVQAGQPTLAIAIRTETGDTTLQAQEWAAIRLAAAQALQPVWQASWAIKDEIAAGTLTDPVAVAAHAAWPAGG